MTIARAGESLAPVTTLPLTPPPPSGGTAAAERLEVAGDVVDQDLGPLDPTPDNVLGPHTKTVFRIWVLVFGLVGAQMGWILRPFIGDPNLPFQWFRQRQSNFFEAVLIAFGNLF
jgi:hypothetical protein